MAEMGASVALKRFLDLGANEKGIKEVNDRVLSLLSTRRMFHWALSHSYLTDTFVQNEDAFRSIAYRIEDVLDIFVADVTVMLQKKETGSIKRFIGKDFLVLEKNILEFNNWDQLKVLTDLVISAICNIPHEPSTTTIEEHGVGMNDESEKLVSLVLEREPRVFSIWGHETGLGKTTIDGKIYKHQLMPRFEAFAWVCLSQGCERKTLFLNILRQLISPILVNETAQEETLIRHLKSVLSRSRCLIVLDNVQDMDQWRPLRPALQMELGHSVILLTTHEEKIANKVGSPHKPRLLNEDEAWNLLKNHALPRNYAPAIGKEMVQKCGYLLPLAISRLGNIMSSENSLHDCKDIQGNQIEGHEQLERISSESKYANLPYYLKLCFLHLGNFSKDEEIDVEELYFLWIAEGIVSSLNEDTEEPAMNRAEKYLNELASRGVVKVQRDELSATRRSQPCFLFSPVQELSWEEEKKKICLEIVDCCNGKQRMPSSSSSSNKIRRLAIHFNQQLEKIAPLSEHDLRDLRSVFLLNTGNKSVKFPLETAAFGKFKLLRILNFVRCKFDGKKLPEGIDKLLNLTYLGLLYCDLDELPSSIGNLRNLRLLNVRVLEHCHLRIPQVFNKLDLLNHLRLPYCTDREQTQKLKLGDLLELETLFGFNSLIHDLDSLYKLNKLRLFGAHAYSNDSLKSLLRFITSRHGARIRTKLFIENKCDFTSKEGVAVLEKVLMCPNLHALTLSMVLMDKVPDCRNRVSSDLTELKLIGCKIKEDPMEALGKFPNLQKLCLGNGAFIGSEMTVQANGFPKLAYLEIRNLPNFEKWRVYEGAMRNLSDLIIQRCPSLKMIPDGLKSISKLKNLEVELAHKAFKDDHKAYLQNFKFVSTLNIRKLDPRSTR